MLKETPILIIAWIRVDKVEKIFNKLNSYGCKNIFLSLDGPRLKNYKNDSTAINKIEELAKKIFDQKVEIKKSSNNLGCKLGVKSAIDWFFENVDRGIILEDDIVPEIEFIEFCTFYLEEYKNDQRIFSISGLNGYLNWLFYPPMKNNELSRRWFVWGWATWKDRWVNKYSEKVDIDLNLIYKILDFYQWNYGLAMEFLISILKVNLNYIDTWDFQVQALCLKRNLLNIIPKNRYIKNIGFDESATHTNFHLDYFENINKSMRNKQLTKEINLPFERESHGMIAIKSNTNYSNKGIFSNLKSLLLISFLMVENIIKRND